MKKMWLLVVLVLCFVLPCIAEAKILGDYKYELLDDGTAEIIKYSGKDTSLTIPDTLDGCTVTSIGEHAFSNSFDPLPLTAVTIPEGVTNIGNFAFYSCANLTSITLPESLLSIGDYAFAKCSMTSIDIPSNITTIGKAAFYGCENLTEINLSPEHPTYAVIDGVLFNQAEKRLMLYPMALPAEQYTVPNGTLAIDAVAFFSCSNLKEITLPQNRSLRSIGDEAFALCTNLTSILIPNGVTTLGSMAFSRCTALTYLSIPSSVTSINGSLLFKNDSLTHVYVDSPSPAENYCIENNIPYLRTPGENWICKDCRSINTGNFCTECGSSKPVDRSNCPYCNYEFFADEHPKFCPNCGTKQ